MTREMVTETGRREEFLPSQARGELKIVHRSGGKRRKALVHSVVGPCVPPLSQGAQVREPALQEARGMQRPALWQTKDGEKKAFASHLPWAKPEEQSRLPKGCGSQKPPEPTARLRGCLWETALGPATQSQQAAQTGLGEPNGGLAAVPWTPPSAFAWS